MRAMQPLVYTSMWRSTHLIASLHKLLTDRLYDDGPKRPLSILSFGCSLGEELVQLRIAFPDANVFGCDVNDAVLGAAQNSVGHVATIFHSSNEQIRAHGRYDAIVALSSLCVSPAPPNLGAVWPFSQFEDMVGFLYEMLNPGGVLMVFNPTYFVQQTSIASDCTIIRPSNVFANSKVQRFHKTGDPAFHIASSSVGLLPAYARASAAEHIADYDMVDCLFMKPTDANHEGGGVIPLDMRPPEITEPGVIDFEWKRVTCDGIGTDDTQTTSRIDVHLVSQLVSQDDGSRFVRTIISRDRIAGRSLMDVATLYFPISTLVSPYSVAQF